METLSELYFATSGIRGKANTLISPELGLRVGRAVSKWVKSQFSKKLYVYVGFDNRRNSHTIASTIVAGLSSSGIDAKLFAKPVPTPLVIYATAKSDAKAGLMVTGSHLPRDENGIILFDQHGSYFKGVLEDSNEPPVEWDDLGVIQNVTYEIQEYQNYLKKLSQELKISATQWDVLLDPVHGPMKSHLEYILKPIVHNLIQFNWKDDDRFSGRLSEPTPKNLKKTSKAVVVSKCDIGIATDMDGDRVIFILPDGKVVSGDYIGAILAMKYWEEFPDLPVVVPINTSAVIEYMADKYNGKFEYCKVGPPSIIGKMRELNAKYGFEETGKYFFSDYAIWPDSSISVLVLISYLQKRSKSLKEIIDSMPELYASKTKVPADRAYGAEIMKLVEEMIPRQFDNITKINSLDGLRVNFDDKSWLLIRPSGTEDYVRVFSEHHIEEKNSELNEIGRRMVTKAIASL